VSSRIKRWTFAGVAIAACAALDPTAGRATTYALFGHPVRLDSGGGLAAWPQGDAPYARVAGLAWHALETRFPIEDNGLPTWLGYSRFDPETLEGIAWPHNPAGFYAMLTDSAVLWYAFSGDGAAVAVVHRALLHQIEHGSTPPDWDWARVPYASAAAGAADYEGADDLWCDYCGRGDGIGVIEPDKVGELGFAYIQGFELTGDVELRDAAVACADALVAHVRAGDRTHSPWPFRVAAKNDVAREEYSSHVIGALMLFDELARLDVGAVAAYRRARAKALDWLLRVPIADEAWSGYFEDVDIHRDPRENPNQYCALRTARWLIAHPGDDPAWRTHVAHLIAWTTRTFGGDTPTERGTQWGATVIGEQHDDIVKMGSHTARYGATLALWSEATGDRTARDRGERSLNWATYACREDGVVAVAEDPNEGWWFSDGYGDYIRHFMAAMASVPDWAPRTEDHLLRSTSIVTHVEYAAHRRIAWTAFDQEATETLRLTFRPSRVVSGDAVLVRRDDLEGSGYTAMPLATGGYLVGVRHSARDVTLSGE
jgi:hypothetical protein